jgi:cell wall-associated NlpC family hydrolase
VWLLKKRVLSLMIAVGIVVSSSVPVLANPQEEQLNSQLAQQQNELQESKGELKELQVQREKIEHEIEILDFDIEKLMRQVNDTKKKIADTQAGIKTAETDIKKAETDMQEEKELYNKRIRALYISGLDGYLSIILQSKGFNDFLTRMETVKRIAEADKKVIANLTVKKQEVIKKKEALDSENIKLTALKASNEEELSKLNQNKNQQATLIADLKAKEKKFAAEIAAEQKLINDTMKRIKDIRNKVPQYSPSRGSADYSQDAVIAYASNFLGTKYVWGGTSPSPGFDCSGFTQYVYRHFGIELPRVSYDQVNVGTPVARDQLQPGDLVFFKKSGQLVHHVGIYVGNNCYMHAPQTGDVVKVSPLTRSDYYAARRVK